MTQDTTPARLPLRPPAPPRRRRPLLAATVAVSALAHAGLLGLFWTESAAKPEAGAVIAVEIVAAPGAAVPSESAAGPSASPGAAASRPAAAPTPPAAPDAPAPRRAAAPPDAAPIRESAALPEAPPRAPAEAAPPKLRATPAAPEATANPRPQPAKPSRAAPAASPAAQPARREVASAETAPEAAPGAGPPAAPPRYGLGSAANPLPRYPEEARERGWEGVVVLTVAVSAAGDAETVAIGRSSGHSVLDRAALEAVRRWRFEPARRAGIAVPGTVSVPIRFRLDG